MPKWFFWENIFEIWKHQFLFTMFSLLRFMTNIWRDNWRLVFDFVKGLCYSSIYCHFLLFDALDSILMYTLYILINWWGIFFPLKDTFRRNLRRTIMRYVNLAIVLVFRLVSMKGSEISKGTLSFKYVQKNNEKILSAKLISGSM